MWFFLLCFMCLYGSTPKIPYPVLSPLKFIYPVPAKRVLLSPYLIPGIPKTEIVKLPLYAAVLLKIYEVNTQIFHRPGFPFTAAVVIAFVITVRLPKTFQGIGRTGISGIPVFYKFKNTAFVPGGKIIPSKQFSRQAFFNCQLPVRRSSGFFEQDEKIRILISNGKSRFFLMAKILFFFERIMP